jgi:RND superfamily putative drug exporter
MTLLGRRAWALPKWLDRVMPNVDVEGEKLRKALAAEETSTAPEPVFAGVPAGGRQGSDDHAAPSVLTSSSGSDASDTPGFASPLPRHHRGRIPGLPGLGQRRANEGDAAPSADTAEPKATPTRGLRNKLFRKS